MAKKLREFQELMHWTNEEMLAQFHWAICVENEVVAASIEAEYDEWLNDYYSDYDAEMLRDAMWLTNHC